MKRILVESIRSKGSKKRGGDFERIEFDSNGVAITSNDDEFLALDTALQRFAEIHSVKANLVKLRFFAGLSQSDAAKALSISRSTADRSWAYARSWLQAEMYRD